MWGNPRTITWYFTNWKSYFLWPNPNEPGIRSQTDLVAAYVSMHGLIDPRIIHITDFIGYKSPARVFTEGKCHHWVRDSICNPNWNSKYRLSSPGPDHLGYSRWWSSSPSQPAISGACMWSRNARSQSAFGRLSGETSYPAESRLRFWWPQSYPLYMDSRPDLWPKFWNTRGWAQSPTQLGHRVWCLHTIGFASFKASAPSRLRARFWHTTSWAYRVELKPDSRIWKLPESE